MKNSYISVIIPAYNEEKSIGNVISRTSEVLDALNIPYEILVVDDGSTDKTNMIASTFKVTLISNSQNHGKGYCLRKALKYANGNIIVTMDSDGEHKPKEIPDLVATLLSGADIVAGSRFMGNKSPVTTKLNRLGNFIFNIIIMSLTGKRVTDSQTGFRAIKREVLEGLDLKSDCYEIETEITIKSLTSDLIFKELPISVERRKNSISKLKILYDGGKIIQTILTANFNV